MKTQNPDQLVNFRNIQKTLTEYQERIEVLEKELAKVQSLVGRMLSERIGAEGKV